jgi:hypothetical protein
MFAREGDIKIIHVDGDIKPFTTYKWNGQAWVYQSEHDLRTEEDVQAFVSEHGLRLVQSGTVGMWPMRVYRKDKEQEHD